MDHIRLLILGLQIPSIIICILELIYVNSESLEWGFFNKYILHSESWWISGIPLSLYYLLFSISILILMILSYRQAMKDSKFFSPYDSNYQSLYNISDQTDKSKNKDKLNGTDGIDEVTIWDRYTFILGNFMNLMNIYYLFLMIYDTKDVSILTCVNYGITFIVTAAIWLFCYMNGNISEFLRLFMVVFSFSFILSLVFFRQYYVSEGRIIPYLKKVVNIPNLSKEDLEFNMKVLMKFIEANGVLYTSSGSPSEIVIELLWGKGCIETLVNYNSMYDCNYNLINKNDWKKCLDDNIQTYPTWVIGDRKYSGVLTPTVMAEQLNLDIGSIKESVEDDNDQVDKERYLKEKVKSGAKFGIEERISKNDHGKKGNKRILKNPNIDDKSLIGETLTENLENKGQDQQFVTLEELGEMIVKDQRDSSNKLNEIEGEDKVSQNFDISYSPEEGSEIQEENKVDIEMSGKENLQNGDNVNQQQTEGKNNLRKSKEGSDADNAVSTDIEALDDESVIVSERISTETLE